MMLETMDKPDRLVKICDIFPDVLGHEKAEVPCFSKASPYVPEMDSCYYFNPSITYALLMGVKYNKRLLMSGYHGTGKSTHIEQVAARLYYPHVRLNLDGYMTRSDLLGKDSLTVQDGYQVTAFQEGILLWAFQRPVMLCLDEYDAGRPELMFVLQRMLEHEGVLAIPDQNILVKAHPHFRIFATSNTIGLGDTTGLYQGTYRLNQAQMDRWDMVCRLDYMPYESEVRMLQQKSMAFKEVDRAPVPLEMIEGMVSLAHLIREGFVQGDLSLPLSPRNLLSWMHNSMLFASLYEAFCFSFLNRLEAEERDIIKEYWQRCFKEEISEIR